MCRVLRWMEGGKIISQSIDGSTSETRGRGDEKKVVNPEKTMTIKRWQSSSISELGWHNSNVVVVVVSFGASIGWRWAIVLDLVGQQWNQNNRTKDISRRLKNLAWLFFFFQFIDRTVIDPSCRVAHAQVYRTLFQQPLTFLLLTYNGTNNSRRMKWIKDGPFFKVSWLRVHLFNCSSPFHPVDR